MSVEFEGTPIHRDNRDKERRLYTIIASRDAEIASLQREISAMAGLYARSMEEVDAVKDELRALKAKERRRSKRRKDAA